MHPHPPPPSYLPLPFPVPGVPLDLRVPLISARPDDPHWTAQAFSAFKSLQWACESWYITHGEEVTEEAVKAATPIFDAFMRRAGGLGGGEGGGGLPGGGGVYPLFLRIVGECLRSISEVEDHSAVRPLSPAEADARFRSETRTRRARRGTSIYEPFAEWPSVRGDSDQNAREALYRCTAWPAFAQFIERRGFADFLSALAALASVARFVVAQALGPALPRRPTQAEA